MVSPFLGTQIVRLKLKALALCPQELVTWKHIKLSWRPRWLDEKEIEIKIKERCQDRLCAHMPRSIACPKTILGEANIALLLVWFQAEREMQNSSEGDQWADNLSKKDFDQYCKQQWLNMLGQQSWYLASSPLVPSQIYILALMLVPWSHLKYIFWSPWWCSFLFHCLQWDNGFREAATEGFQRKHPPWQVQVRF